MKPSSFATLQGYTNDADRRVHNSVATGVNCYYTPFVRLDRGEVRNRDLNDVSIENNKGVPIIPQIIVSSADEFNHLAKLLASMGHKKIDINMGCPFPLQTKLGRGSKLLTYADTVKSIFDSFNNFEGVEFSLKMRLGFENNSDAYNLLPILNSAKLSHITMHPRTGKQQYKGTVDEPAFLRFYEECAHPLIYNGDLTTLEDLQRVENKYPNLLGIMMGRGLLQRPTLATEYQLGETRD